MTRWKKRATLVAGGGRHTSEKRYFYNPTVLTDVTDRYANRLRRGLRTGDGGQRLLDALTKRFSWPMTRPYGLAGYVMTRDLSTATRVYEGLEFGIVGVQRHGAGDGGSALRRCQDQRLRARSRARRLTGIHGAEVRFNRAGLTGFAHIFNCAEVAAVAIRARVAELVGRRAVGGIGGVDGGAALQERATAVFFHEIT